MVTKYVKLLVFIKKNIYIKINRKRTKCRFPLKRKENTTYSSLFCSSQIVEPVTDVLGHFFMVDKF